MPTTLCRVDEEIFSLWRKVSILISFCRNMRYLSSRHRVIEVTGDMDLRNSFELIAQASIIITTVRVDFLRYFTYHDAFPLTAREVGFSHSLLEGTYISIWSS